MSRLLGASVYVTGAVVCVCEQIYVNDGFVDSLLVNMLVLLVCLLLL